MVFKKVFKISANIPAEVANFNEPYLLLANHYGRYDPFIIGDFIKKKPNFVSSDAILRDPLYGPLFKRMGAIPKKKGVRDTHLIREIIKVIDNGGAIGLFPEATRTWSGTTHYIDPSIAKLAKLFKVPVITAKMKGAYAFDPRWARPLRKAKMEIDFEIAVTKEQLKALNSEEVMEIINSKLDHDDIAYAREQKIKIKSNYRAEYIERMLFQCPDCKSYDGFTSAKNSFSCNACNYTIDIDEYGFFTSKGDMHFDNPRDWLNWQNQNFVDDITKRLSQDIDTPLFEAESIKIHEAIGEGRMKERGIGKLLFYSNRIQFVSSSFNIELPHKDIATLSPQFMEKVELYFLGNAYRFTSMQHQEPGIKWELAINAVWAQTDQGYKLSTYFKHLY